MVLKQLNLLVRPRMQFLIFGIIVRSIDEVTDTISRHKYTTLGSKKIIVTPLFYGCLGNSDSFNINVIGVIAKFQFRNLCTDKKTFFFTNRSLGNQSSIIWDFGDGSPQDNSVNLFHTFADTGSYVVHFNGYVIILRDALTPIRKQLLSPIRYLPIPIKLFAHNSTTTFTVSNLYTGLRRNTHGM